MVVEAEEAKPELSRTFIVPAERLTWRLVEVARALGVSRRTIERERSAGRFPKPDLTIGKTPLWTRESLVRWIEEGSGRKGEIMFNQIGVRHSEVSDSGETPVPTGRHEPREGPESVSPPPGSPPPLALPVREPAEPMREERPELAPSAPSQDALLLAAEELRVERGQDRRVWRRYKLSGAQSLLCCWESLEVPPYPDPAPTPERTARPAKSTIHSAVMARGPAFRDVQGVLDRLLERLEVRREAAALKESKKPRYSYGVVVNISQSGMAVLCDNAPRSPEKIRLRLERPLLTDWVEVDLKGVTLSTQGPHLVRLAFRHLCPYDFFKAAVYGRPKP